MNKSQELLNVFESDKSKKSEGNFHPKDDLLRGMTFEELITTVESNEKVRDKNSVMKVYREILSANQKDALSELRSNMDAIVKILNKE